MSHMHGEYVGEDRGPDLRGKTALLRQHPDHEGVLLAQFDDMERLPRELTHGWSEFPATDFKIDPPIDWS